MINVTKKSVSVELYTWSCPSCGGIIESYDTPANNEDFRCGVCQDKLSDQRKAEWMAKFKAGHALNGGKIVDIVPETNDWWESDPDFADIEMLIVEANGKRYRVTAEGPIYYREEK